jgi:CRP-like cAMP-binding protein
MDLAERMLYFRALPANGMATAEELLPLAESAGEVFIRRGTTVFAENIPPDRLVFLTEGSVSLVRGVLEIDTIQAPGVLGIRAVMAHAPMPYAVLARENLTALEAPIERFLQAMEDDFSVWKRQLRFQNALLVRHIEQSPHTLLGMSRIDLGGLPVERDLDLVERMLLVRRLGFFGRGSVNALAEMAQQLVAVEARAGQAVFRRGEPAVGPWFLLRGEIRGTLADGRTIAFLPGTILGGPEAMADVPHLYDAVATEPSALLRLDLESFFDVVEDNIEIASTFLASTARLVMDMDIERLVKAAQLARSAVTKTMDSPG